MRTWLVLEDDGRWCPKALASAELPDAVRERLLELKATPGWRPVLVRPRVADGRRRLWLARTLPGEEALFQWTLDRPEDLLDLPLEPIALGHQDGPRVDGPLVLVCMHGQRPSETRMEPMTWTPSKDRSPESCRWACRAAWTWRSHATRPR